MPDALCIGSRSSNDIVFDEAMVSGHHAEIARLPDDTLVLRDLGSTNGTFVNGERVHHPEPLQVGDTIGLGSFSFTLTEEHIAPLLPTPEPTPDPPRAQPRAMATVAELSPIAPPAKKPDTSKTVTEDLVGVTAAAITLGYQSNNAISIPAPQVSSYHARISKRGDTFTIVDLNSTNGTFVNGERIHHPQPLQLGDTVGLGSYRFTFDESITHHFQTAPKPKTLAMAAAHTRGTSPPRRLTLGRADNNDIIIPAPQVAGHHAHLDPDGAGGYFITDTGSLFGTYINNRNNALIPHTQHPLSEQDVLFLGSYRFPLSRVSDFVRTQGESQAIQIPEDKERITIGRNKSNDIQLDEPQVSRNHAVLVKTDKGWVIEDIGSANGTFVNGVRITKRLITKRDSIGFGSFAVRLDPTAGVIHKEYQGEIMLRAEGISIDVPDPQTGTKRIIHNISFTAYPTEFIGIMGPSGAGKTTLLMALNGYLQPTEGKSLINNLDLYQHYNTFRGNIGYVPQDDIIHHELTVFESLYFTAKLRLPPDTTDEEIEALIDKILKDLGIFETKNVHIGSPIKKGISGGQRKRVNLAQELITQPSLLFLDEPTSGLASSDTQSVMELLRRLADEGRTILLTIHQPSLQVYREMDNVLYLTRGRLVYYGPAYPDSILYFNTDVEPDTPDGDRILSNPDSALAPLAADNEAPDLIERIEQRTQSYVQSQYYKDYVSGRREGQEVQLEKAGKERVARNFGFRQWWTLTRRTFTIKRKDVANTAILLLQAPIIALLIAAVFSLKNAPDETVFGQFLATRSKDSIDAAAFFMLVASAVWFGCSNSAREIVSELAIYKRERMLNLKIPSYVLAKFAVLSFVCLLQCLMLLGISYPLLGFNASFLELLLPLFLCAASGIGIGLLLSAVVRSTEAAVALVPLLLIPQLVLGGLIVPLGNMEGGYRSAIRYTSNLMVARWAFESLLHAEDANRPPPPEIKPPPEVEAQASDFSLSKVFSRLQDLPPRPNIPFAINSKQRKALKEWEQRLQDLEVRITQQVEAVTQVNAAKDLSRQLQETQHIDRYFGSFQTSFRTTNLILLSFILTLIGLVCLILRLKDEDLG